MKKVFNKLVRDNIPSIIRSNNEICDTRVLEFEEYVSELNTKLSEEVKEYLDSGDTEEIADIVEVLYALLDAKGVSIEEFENIRLSKVAKRGAFKDRIFLISTDSVDSE